jgi:serine/threonine protein kinase/tetratricopeptide (TPR) repeat protein
MADPSNQAKSIFLAALEAHAPDRWPTFLEQACGGDAQLRAEVEKLLRARSEIGSFHEVQRPALPATRDEAISGAISEGPGAVIGPFKLLERIGEGGFGVVFMAEQLHPVRRKVALKVLKPGMDTHQVIARFEAERQALALMDHPNIAHILDGGATTSGRPYFVMELVRGIPITQFCDQNRLPVAQRLELFITICHAVQHAHQKGIIHRDLKPTNVLVTLHDDKAVAKVIDFGIAKASGQQLTEKTLFTNFAQMIGTPLYMSPEQAQMSGLDVDTRSDVYSLGMMLYELLTGTTAFDKERLKTMGYDEICRMIREEEPPKPSTRISTLAKAGTTLSMRGKSDPKRLRHLFRGELDWIVMKCLEKDRTRRYQTASGLAMDLQHYLADEPVLACPPSAAYRLRKFARKYRALLRIAALFVLLLVAAAAVSTWQAVRATRERDRAEASFRMARDAVDQLFTQVSQSPQMKTQGMEKFRKKLLQSARSFYERFIQEEFDTPAVRYDLGLAYHRLTDINRELGDTAAAEESSAKAIALLGELAAAQPDVPEYQRELAASHFALGLVYFATAAWEKAEAAFELAVTIQKKQADAYPTAAEYRYALAKTYRASGFAHSRRHQNDAAVARYQQALEILSKSVQDHPVPEHQSLLATTQMNLANMYITRNWFVKAEPALKEAQRIYAQLVHDRSDLPEHLQSLGQCHAILGMAYRGQSRNDEAEAAQQHAVDIFEKLAKEHPDVPEYAYDVGRCYLELGLTANQVGRPEAAVARYDKAVAILEGVVAAGLKSARNALVSARIDRSTARAAGGAHAQAAAESDAVFRQGGLHSGHLYDLACTFSQCSAAADRDGKLSPADRAVLKARYAERAVRFLQQAIADGWRNPQHLKTDPDVEPLRARQDFQKLLADLEAKTKE